MDSDDERIKKRQRTETLTQLFEDDSPPRPRESIPNSCSEESSDEEDLKPLPILRAGASNGVKKMPSFMTHKSSGLPAPAATSAASRPRPPVAKTPSVHINEGYGGRKEYSVVKDHKAATYYCVQWRKPQQKKHKTWDGDAWLRVDGQKIFMIGEDGKVMGVGSLANGGEPQSGQTFRIGSFDTEVDREVTHEEFRAATTVLNKQGIAATPSFMTPNAARPGASRTFAKSFKTPKVISKPKESAYIHPREVVDVDLDDSPGPATPFPVVKPMRSGDMAISKYAYQNPVATTPRPEAAKIHVGVKANEDRSNWGGAVHNPHAEGAVVMPRPPEDWARKQNTSLVDVVIDPDLSGLMRAHQKEGVKFMYSCVMGMTEAEGEGCILADEMGLGKTLSAIALIYTMLRQSPFKKDTACAHKILIVCPVTLVKNWQKEFRKWVDKRVNVVAADGRDNEILSFVNNRSKHVLIIGYERLRKVVKQLASCVPSIDLIICDEGQRLKSKDNKTTKMFDELRTVRRILLSGTPVQNDLGEYWAMANFVNPGIFGTYSQFNRQFEKPILKGRAPGASKRDVTEGQERSQELTKVAQAFVIRRTAEVLDNYLPPKNEYVVFVAPSKLQLKIFQTLLAPNMLAAFLQSRTQPLGFIDTLRKICNSPLLLKKKAAKEDIQYDENEVKSVLEQALAVMPPNIKDYDVSTSGKMQLLYNMLREVHNHTGEKVVVVSNWTSTLDIIQEMLGSIKYPYLRLDGSTPQKTRQDLVDQFNKGRREDSFVFLLSAKAGGTGLNLIGASRLILFDSDWNPSTDLQAMARIHRDGQKRPVYIYRLLTACTIDEKIYQRQVTKTGLSDQMLDKKAGEKSSNSFSDAELRDLFTLSIKTDGCQTHDLLGCDCHGLEEGVLKEKDVNVAGESEDESDEDSKGFVVASQYDPAPTAKMVKKSEQAKRDKLSALKKWKHLDPHERSSFDTMSDTLLHGLIYSEWESTKFSKAVEEEEAEMDGIESANSADEIDVRNQSASSSGSGGSKKEVKKEKKKKRVDIGGLETKRKYDLNVIANGGGGGKVMYMFEKVSKSKMLDKTEV